MPRRGHRWSVDPPTVPALTGQLAAAREELSRTRDELRDALERRAVAEQSAKDAWRFAKALSGAGRPK